MTSVYVSRPLSLLRVRLQPSRSTVPRLPRFPTVAFLTRRSPSPRPRRQLWRRRMSSHFSQPLRKA